MSVERMWREVDAHLGGCVWTFRGMIGENGRIFGGSERHLGIVGAPTPKSGGPMGEVDLERSLDGGWSCLELVAVRAIKELCGVVWSCVESYDDGECGGVGCTVPQSACTPS